MNNTKQIQHTSDQQTRVSLSALAPRQAWVQQLGAIGKHAADRRRALSVLNGGLSQAGRWGLPAAMTLAAAVWLLSARRTPAAEAAPSVLMASSDSELRAAIVLSLENHR
jgi:hypothetical protein